MLKIGELASLTGVSRDTLRFYEKHGLILPSQRTESGYRLYSDRDVERISFIVSAKEVGFTLNEIHQLLELEVTKDKKSCEDVKEFVDNKITIVNQRLLEMEKMKERSHRYCFIANSLSEEVKIAKQRKDAKIIFSTKKNFR